MGSQTPEIGEGGKVCSLGTVFLSGAELDSDQKTEGPVVAGGAFRLNPMW